ncbi:hypothetical protein NDU88_001379 [Pleurodeles waltl]|uniref:Secreted protein n=1 Tax=Pleurodeles waltl TaxID=8319 RepID=A0AAV7TIY2_PLEWA|nr:hypothetical protein NDU88_001379 [Pleurodeles waltl]
MFSGSWVLLYTVVHAVLGVLLPSTAGTDVTLPRTRGGKSLLQVPPRLRGLRGLYPPRRSLWVRRAAPRPLLRSAPGSMPE